MLATVDGVLYSWPIDRTHLPALPDVPVLPDDPSGAEQSTHDAAQAAYDAALSARNAAEDLAVAVLWALSGRQFGVYETTVRPCVVDGGHYLWGLRGRQVGCGCPGLGACERSGPRVVHLLGPVQPDTDDTPVTVAVAGVEMDHALYTVEGDALYRNGSVWPRQHLDRPLGDLGTWSVTYWRGVPAPQVVAPLVGQLAREFVLATSDDSGECRLPSTLTQLSRQGVTHVFDPARILSAGYTGLTEVDRWLVSVNPARLAQAPVVL